MQLLLIHKFKPLYAVCNSEDVAEYTYKLLHLWFSESYTEKREAALKAAKYIKSEDILLFLI